MCLLTLFFSLGDTILILSYLVGKMIEKAFFVVGSDESPLGQGASVVNYLINGVPISYAFNRFGEDRQLNLCPIGEFKLACLKALGVGHIVCANFSSENNALSILKKIDFDIKEKFKLPMARSDRYAVLFLLEEDSEVNFLQSLGVMDTNKEASFDLVCVDIASAGFKLDPEFVDYTPSSESKVH